MKRILVLCAAVGMLLCGCASLFDGSYISTIPHQEQGGASMGDHVQAEEYGQLLAAVTNLAVSGTENGVIYVPVYDPTDISRDMERAVKAVQRANPIAAYAVEEITWELGTSNGQRAVAVEIAYRHDRTEILKIREAANMEEAFQMVYDVLSDYSSGVVLYIQDYERTDFVRLVEDYAFTYPQEVMEKPQVTANIFPDSGSSRVVELKFAYQNNRDTLRSMRTLVQRIFISAEYYISSEASDAQTFSQLYTHLMERFDQYKQETSITPAYSLLQYGVGDSKAFATVYAAMCRSIDLDCQVVSGTHQGEPWHWNMVKTEDGYYHLDLLRKQEGYQLFTDGQMAGYVWNYDAYPACPDVLGPTVPEHIQPTQETTPQQ